jgi:Domain of unknown function (DUF4352)
LSRRLALRGFGAVGVGAAGAALARRGPAAAQDDGTPAADGCAADPRVGDAVSVVGPEGSEVVQVTASELLDRFEDYDPRYPPQPGHRFTVIRIEVEVTGPRPFTVVPGAFFLQDADGFTYTPIGITLPAETTQVLLAQSDLASESNIGGLIAFQVVRDVGLARLFYSPASGRLLMVADLRG